MYKKIKTIIVEDEVEGMNNLVFKINTYCPNIEIIDKCFDVPTAIDSLKSLNPDLVLLDVRLGNTSSFEILQELDFIPFEIIFITGYAEYAINAIKYNALDYLLKPIKPEELVMAVKKIRLKVDSRKKIKKIALPIGEGILFISLSDILYCLADDSYTKIYKLSESKSTLITKTLKYIQERLVGSNFMRISRSAVINLDHVQSFRKSNGGSVIMQNGDELSVSKDKRQELLSKVIY